MTDYYDQHEINKRLEKLEQYMEMEDRVTCSDVLCKLALLHEHKTRQIDENRKISQRVDELEQLVASLSQKKDVESLAQNYGSCSWCNGTGRQQFMAVPCGNNL